MAGTGIEIRQELNSLSLKRYNKIRTNLRANSQEKETLSGLETLETIFIKGTKPANNENRHGSTPEIKEP